MTRRDDGEDERASRRALRILERLSGSGSSSGVEVDSLQNTRLADRLHQIEQLFLLHGGEREAERGPESILFDWGHLQVLERIGEGSSGEVFRAYDRTLDREVALKLLKTDRGRPFQSQLFLHEARQLAMVRHRNVLAVHGAAVQDGRPGLWTDLIAGGTADDAAHRAALEDPGAVLDLVESLALAVDAVHSVGLVHGDIKPSNIMRDASGEWVLMDFGASQDQRGGPDGPSITSGTPLYMAPEVVLGDPPDVASDLYSLGATLYRVLTGKVPIPAAQWTELVEKHRAGERPAPAGSAGSLDRRIARLIDALMARDPDQRPPLPEVIEQVRAVREAPQRRFRRIALGGIAAALVIGLTLTSIGFYRANDARLLAEREQRNTFAVNEFLQRLVHAPSSSGRGRDLTVEQMLDEAAANVERALDGQNEARVIVHRVLADSYNALQLTDRANEQIELARQVIAEHELRMPVIERKLALEEIVSASVSDRDEQAIDLARRFLATYADALGEQDLDVRYARTFIVEAYLKLDRNDDAERLLDKYFSEVPAPETAPDPFGFNILRNRTFLLIQQGRFDEATLAAERAVDWLERYPAPRPNDRADALATLARSLARVNQLQRAIDLQKQVIPIRARIDGSGSSEHVGAMSDLAVYQREIGRVVESGETLRAALHAIDENPGDVSDVIRLTIMSNLANVLNETGQQAQGEALIRETHAESVELFGARSQQVLILEYNLAEQLTLKGRFDEARALAEQTLEAKKGAFGETHYLTLMTMDNLAVALAGLGRGEQALDLQERALKALNEQLGSEHPYTLVVERNRMTTLQNNAPHRIESGEVEDLIRRHETALGGEHPDTAKARALLDR